MNYHKGSVGKVLEVPFSCCLVVKSLVMQLDEKLNLLTFMMILQEKYYKQSLIGKYAMQKSYKGIPIYSVPSKDLSMYSWQAFNVECAY